MGGILKISRMEKEILKTVDLTKNSIIPTFNFFKILEKDNKELIHSAFISYLLDNNKNFRKEFIHGKIEDFNSSELEKSYSFKKLRIRIDIELKSKDGKFITIIENKFKSFPTKKQLEDYNTVFKNKFKKPFELKKILFCFDKNIVKFKTDWVIFDYKDLLIFLRQDYKSKNHTDEHIFVKHYISFLSYYIETYKDLKSNCNHLYESNLSKDDKFWVRLLNSQIAMEFEKEFPDKNFDFVINTGNAGIPFLDIIPKHWEEKTKEKLLIEFQGDDLKFYLHSKNIEDSASKLINYCESKIWDNNIELKKLNQSSPKTCFIFKTKLTQNLDSNFKYKELFDLIVDFYKKIDLKIIQTYI